MNRIPLDAGDIIYAIPVIGILLLVIFAPHIYGIITAFLFKTRVGIRRGGGIVYTPDDLPNAVGYVLRNSKTIYDKIRKKIGDSRLSTLQNTPDKLERLRQLSELRDKQVITENEFQALKAEILA